VKEIPDTVNIVTLLPFIVIIGAMFLMTRSAKNKQRQAASMREQMQPGTGVRTIGGMYAVVKEVHDEAVLLEEAPGVHAFYAKNAIGAVLDDEEYNRIIHGVEPEPADDITAPDDASSLTGDALTKDAPSKDALSKDAPADDRPADDRPADDAPADEENVDLGKKPEGKDAKDGKKDGGSTAK
jgi:preprotein translocase subunit YajC